MAFAVANSRFGTFSLSSCNTATVAARTMDKLLQPHTPSLNFSPTPLHFYAEIVVFVPISQLQSLLLFSLLLKHTFKKLRSLQVPPRVGKKNI